MDDPQDEEITFDIIELPKQPEYMENIISIDEIKNFKPGTPIDVSGRAYLSKGKLTSWMSGATILESKNLLWQMSLEQFDWYYGKQI